MYIYVAFGEHLAAGGVYVFLFHPGGCLSNTLDGIVMSFCDCDPSGALLWHLYLHCCTLEYMLMSFQYVGGPRGSSLAPLGDIGIPC